MPTKVTLTTRHHGVHSTVKEMFIDAEYTALAKTENGERIVDEEALLAAIPKGWIPVDVSKVLLTMDDWFVYETKRFKSYGKYFDAYCVDIKPSHVAS